MCCAFATLVFLGPRFFTFMWWLLQPSRFNLTFNTFVMPFLGVLFIPWTTLMYLIVSPGGVTGFDWIWIFLALLCDISSYADQGYGSRNYVPGYAPDNTMM